MVQVAAVSADIFDDVCWVKNSFSQTLKNGRENCSKNWTIIRLRD